MLTKKEQRLYRSSLFRHLDGLATVPTLSVLSGKGVLAHLLKSKKVEIGQLSRYFNANEGYLNVALRLLCSQGWLNQEIDNSKGVVFYYTNDRSAYAFDLVPRFLEVYDFLKKLEEFNVKNIDPGVLVNMDKLFNSLILDFDIPEISDECLGEVRHQVLMHIEGALVGPVIVMLGMGGMFHQYFMEASFRAGEYHEDAENFEIILDFLTHLKWFIKKNNTYEFTPKGLFFAKRASAYGVTVSYLPTFRKLEELIFRDPLVLKTPSGEREKHVDREMNVWGSGGAHSAYFKKVDEIIIDLFNRPIGEQPKGVLDMGCGNGAFLIHIFDVIEKRTYRGKVLDEYPLLLVGADYNDSALKVTRANLVKSDIWAKVVWGDIGKPELLAENLREDYGIDISELLNVRTFLDHNRIWTPPEKRTDRVSKSTGAFAFEGRRLGNNEVEDNLLEHFKKWLPFIHKFGLLVIELHTIDPVLTSANLGRIPTTAYDATHGYSDQYILEADVFLQIASEAGLKTDERLKAKFPDSDLATITVNLLKGK
nr:class I SAM-dependent methyltransferase [Saprospiraceae bacterium]